MKVLRWITASVLIVCLVFSFLCVKDVLTDDALEKTPAKYKGILTIWQVDSFEGGTGSRKQFLLSVARGYERKNEGVLVMVISHTKASLENAIKENQTPDIISFGNGVDVNGAMLLNCNKTVAGGYVGNKVYATAWAKGSYFLIGNSTLVNEFPKKFSSLLVSEQEYTQPLLSLWLDNVEADQIEVLKPMDAYVKFTSGKSPYLLATQRDVYRLNNRGMSFIAKPLENYNDLYQYMVVTANSKEKRIACEGFLNYLLSEDVQKKLDDIGMLSPYYKISYENALNEVTLNKQRYTLSAFISEQQLKELQYLSKSAVSGNKDSQNKIKNIVIKS